MSNFSYNTIILATTHADQALTFTVSMSGNMMLMCANTVILERDISSGHTLLIIVYKTTNRLHAGYRPLKKWNLKLVVGG